MHVRKILEDVRSSLWFVPGTIVMGSIALAYLLLGAEWPNLTNTLRHRAPRLFVTYPDDARQLLGAIATSVLTVAGVSFSVTAVTLSLIASQYTPRVVRSFMRSRKTQITLGILMGVYAYALVVLRMMGNRDSYEVPDLAINFANLYAILGLFVFIMFVHHMASFIQPATIAAGVFAETLHAIKATYPEEISDACKVEPENVELDGTSLSWHALPAPKAGYIQGVDVEDLIRHGTSARSTVRAAFKVGEFVVEGEPLLYVANTMPDRRGMRRLIRAVDIGTHRTIEQDPGFGVRQIVDMALKGLSPSIHDPTTAMLCIDHLGALLMHLGRRRSQDAHRDKRGAIVALVSRASFEDILRNAVEPICLAGKDHPQVLERLVYMLAEMARRVPRGPRRQAVWAQVALVADQATRLGAVPGRSRAVMIAQRILAEREEERSK